VRACGRSLSDKSDSIRDARFQMADESGRSLPAAMNAGREVSLRRFADRHSAITGRVRGALTKDFRAAVPVLCRCTSDRDPVTTNPAIMSFRRRFC
jgi:hypothetical protein